MRSSVLRAEYVSGKGRLIQLRRQYNTIVCLHRTLNGGGKCGVFTPFPEKEYYMNQVEELNKSIQSITEEAEAKVEEAKAATDIAEERAQKAEERAQKAEAKQAPAFEQEDLAPAADKNVSPASCTRVTLASMPKVNKDGVAKEGAESTLEKIRDEATRRLDRIIGNRSSEYYVTQIDQRIKSVKKRHEGENEMSKQLRPDLKRFMEQVQDTKDMKDMDAWARKTRFQEMFNSVQDKLGTVLDAMDLEHILNDLYGKSITVLKGNKEKATRIGKLTSQKSSAVYEYLKKKFMPETKLKGVEAEKERLEELKAFKKKVSTFCNSTNERVVEANQIQEMNYSETRLHLMKPNVIMLPTEAGDEMHLSNYVKKGDHSIVVTLGASATFTTESKDPESGWVMQRMKVQQGEDKILISTTPECMLSENVSRADNAVTACKDALRKMRDALLLEFDRKTGGIVVAMGSQSKPTYLSNFFRDDDDLARLDLASTLPINDVEVLKDPTVSLVILRVFPANPDDTYSLIGKCLYDGCEETDWGSGINHVDQAMKQYYVRNGLRFFEINYDIDMRAYGTQNFGEMKLEGDGDVRELHYQVTTDVVRKIHVRRLPEVNDWATGLLRLCGPNGEPVKDHNWEDTEPPSPPTITSAERQANSSVIIIHVNVGSNEVLRSIKLVAADDNGEIATFSRTFSGKKITPNPLGHYKLTRTKELEWVAPSPNEPLEFQQDGVNATRVYVIAVDRLGRTSQPSNHVTLDGLATDASEKKASDAPASETLEPPKALPDLDVSETSEKGSEEGALPDLNATQEALEKYRKMRKVGIPLPMINNAIRKDGKDPEVFMPHLQGGAGETLNVTLEVPLKNGRWENMSMEVPRDMLVSEFDAEILKKLRAEGVMSEYHVFPGKNGYNQKWKSIMVFIYTTLEWKGKNPMTQKFTQVLLPNTAQTRKDIQSEIEAQVVKEGTSNEDVADFLTWFLPQVPCVTTERHYEGLKKLLATPSTLSGYKTIYDKDIEKVIKNEEYTSYKDIPRTGAFKTWLKGLANKGEWRCDDPDNSKAKFKLESLRTAVGQYMWTSLVPDEDRLKEWAKNLDVDTVQAKLLFNSVLKFGRDGPFKGGTITTLAKRNIGKELKPNQLMVSYMEGYNLNTTEMFNVWLSQNFPQSPPPQWRDVQHRLMEILVPK